MSSSCPDNRLSPRYGQPVSVLHLITTLDVGGAEMMLYRLVSNANQDFFEHVVVTLADIGAVGRKIQELGIPVHALRMRGFSPKPRGALQLLRRLRQAPAEIVHTWMYHADFAGLFLSRMIGRPKLVWTVRCARVSLFQYRPLTGLIAKLCAALSPLPDAIIINSHAGMRHHVNLGYSPRRMHLIPNGFDVERFRPDSDARLAVRRELGLPEDCLIIGLVARWDPLKDHSTFVKSASMIARKHHNVYFLLIGRDVKWDTAEVSTLIEDAGLQERAILLGERDDMPRLTAAFDIACSSSITEGFPTTVGEAMACGVPCVVTDVGDAAMLVGDTGRVVPPGDASAFAGACKELIAMGTDGRRELGDKARDRINNQYTLGSIVGKYENLYMNLVGRTKMRS